MLKRMLFVGVLMAVLASTAVGASITNISEAIVGGGSYGKTPYLVGSMSSDGRYVGITRPYQMPAPDLRWFDGPCLFDTTTSSYLPLKIKSGNGSTRGVEAMANGMPISIVAEGDGNLASWRRDVIGGPSNASGGCGSGQGMVGSHSANNMAMDADGNGWMVGGTEGSKPNPDNAKAWKITNGVVSTTDSYNTQPYPGKNVLNGVSRSGLAVGNWVDASGDRIMIRNVTGAGGGRALKPADHFASTISNKGQGNAMSGNGLWAGGYFTVTENANSLHGWRTLVDTSWTTDGAMEELLPVGFDPLVGQQSNVFDIADDGTAAGYSYDPTSGYRATLWNPGSDQGVLVSAILAGLGVDMSEWQELERVMSISDDGTVVAGRGILVGGSYSAFVAVIPEPGTLSLLALGGLALLRRRR